MLGTINNDNQKCLTCIHKNEDGAPTCQTCNMDDKYESGKKVLVVGDNSLIPKKEVQSKINDMLAPYLFTQMMGWNGEPSFPHGFGYTNTPHLTKCGLPSCHKISEKDYCCAEHYKEHKTLHLNNLK